MTLLFKNCSWYLEGMMPGGKSWIIPLDKFPFTVGRNTDCHLCLNSVSISRKHARFRSTNGEIYISDLKSTNGTVVNNGKINEERKIENNDTISFGEFEFKIHNVEPENEGQFENTLIDDPSKAGSEFVKAFKLTKKESEVLKLLLKGVSTKEIAKMISVSAGTAKNHILSIYKKTDAHSKFELFALYREIEGE